MISYLANKTTNTPLGSLSLEDLHNQLIDPTEEPFSKSKEIVARLRSTNDKALKKRLKGTLPVIVPGAEIRTKDKYAPLQYKVKQYSGFVQVDIDPNDNPNLSNAVMLRDWLAANIPYMALVAVSASGNGVWGLIQIEFPEKFQSYAGPISSYFENAGITIDKTKSKNPLELRFFAPDPGAILIPDHQLFPLNPETKVLIPKCEKKILPVTNNSIFRSQNSIEEQCVEWVRSRVGYSLVEGQKHNFIFWLCYALYKNGLNESEIESYIYTLTPKSQIRSNCIKGGIKHARLNGN